VTVDESVDPDTNGRDIIFTVRAGQRARLGKIEIVGGSHIDPAGLARAFGLRRDAYFRDAEVREGVLRVQEQLRKEGYFEGRVADSHVLWNRAENRVDIRVELSEGAKFRVEFVGNRELKDALLSERLMLEDSGVVDETEIRANARQIEALYRENGYHFVRVQAALETADSPQTVRFVIEEGPKVVVRSVRFSGNESFSAERLQGKILTRPAALLHKGLLRQEALELDVRILQEFFRSEGFADAEVGPAELDFDEERSRVDVVFPIREGRRLGVGEIAVVGLTVISSKEAIEALPVKKGDFWHLAKAEEGRGVLERLLARRGYHAARVDLETARRDGSMEIVYSVDEGGQTRIGRVLVNGLILTRQDVVWRSLPFRPGDPFNPDDMLQAERRLAGLGLFDQVEVQPLRPAPLAYSDVRVGVRERKPWRVDFGLGYNSDTGGRGFLEVGHDNLWGTGRAASFREELSERGDRTDLGFREPWLFGTRWQGDARFFRERRQEIGFELDRLGLSIGMQRELFPERVAGLNAALGYRIEQVRRFRVDPTLAVQDVEAGREVVARMTSSLTLDRRDNPLDPKSGSFHLASAEFGAMALGSELSFFRSRLETYWFFHWPPPTVLALSGRLGFAAPLGATDDVAIEDRFFAGGSTTVRGFRDNRLGPRDSAGNPTGGNAQAIVNIEWRFPLWNWLGGAIFWDMGAIGREWETLSARDFRSGIGSGLRLKTPVGPIRLDFGYALNPIAGDKPWQIYLSVGNPF
jgi:outer membrane protein insertion porin family